VKDANVIHDSVLHGAPEVNAHSWLRSVDVIRTAFQATTNGRNVHHYTDRMVRPAVFLLRIRGLRSRTEASVRDGCRKIDRLFPVGEGGTSVVVIGLPKLVKVHPAQRSENFMFERLQRRWKRSFGNKEQSWSVRPVEPQVLGASSVLGCDVFRSVDSIRTFFQTTQIQVRIPAFGTEVI